MEILLFSTEQCEVLLDDNIGCIVVDWLGYATSEQFREIHANLLTEIRIHKVTMIVGNALDLVQIGAADQRWVLKDFLPLLIEAGVRVDAVVRSRHYFSQVAIEAIHQQDNEMVSRKYFDNKDEAKNWLRGFLPYSVA